MAKASLALTLVPSELSSERLQDVSIELLFQSAAELYIDAAQIADHPGWSSPSWDLEFSPKGTLRHHLRTYYGPPGSPPNQGYFESCKREALKEPFLHQLPACFVPRRCLRPENLAKQTLDPSSMDGLGKMPSGASVLMIGRKREEVERTMSERVDFLRPGFCVFFPDAGDFRVTATYRHKSWSGFFKPKSKLSLKSAPINLSIP